MRKRRALIAVTALAVALLQLPTAAAGTKPSYSKPILLVGTDPIGATLGNGVRQAVGEPSIKVDSSGTVFITGADTVGRPAPAWFSSDGKTFKELASPGMFRERTIGAEGDFAIDDQDHVYMIDTAVPYLVLTRWSNHGKTWDFTHPVTLGVVPGLDDRPWLAWAKGVLSLFVNHGTHVEMYTSTDEGQSFQLAYETLTDTGLLFPGVIAADNTKSSRYYGGVYVFGDCGDGHTMCSAASHDEGGTWTTAKVPKPPGHRTRLAPQLSLSVDVDRGGTVYGVWAADDVKPDADGNDTPGTGCTVWLTESQDGAKTWSKPVRANRDARGCATFPAISAGAAGKVVLSYYQETSSAKAQDNVDKHAAWFLHAEYNLHASSKPGAFSDSVADPKPVHLGPLERELWDFFQVDVGPDGYANIAYSQDTRSGPDGPEGCECAPDALGAQRSKDVMYVKETAGPKLT